MKMLRFIAIVIFLSSSFAFGQIPFNLQNYKSFLQSNQQLTAEGLKQMHNAGVFKAAGNIMFSEALFFRKIDSIYQLTAFEKENLSKYGFMVSSRLTNSSFGAALGEVFYRDLPVYISTDAIIHAWHMSYSRLLERVEEECLSVQLGKYLDTMHAALSDMQSEYSSRPEMTIMLKDIDLYLTVPRKILSSSAAPLYSENEEKVSSFLSCISSLQVQSVYYMSTNCRTIDFSQFKPRAHYTNSVTLQNYFKAMMWLAKMELYLLPPRGVDMNCSGQSAEDIRRQTIDAFLLREMMNVSGANEFYNQIESLITFFTGEQDNVTFPNLDYLASAINLNSPAEFLLDSKLSLFQDSLRKQGFAYQKILSQIIAQNPMAPDSIIPAASFMPFGQRFIIDSYVTGSVVYDRIKYNGMYVKRMLPSTLDVMFSLGNNAAAQLLQGELDYYHYAPNLAALRYLVDSQPQAFWDSTVFNFWLKAIRNLNPPSSRSTLPAYMQTGAFWQKMLNTQLFAWTELRHDNLLYAKQSYTGGSTCLFPYTYIEPFPEFYNSIMNMAAKMKDKFANILPPGLTTTRINYYLSNVIDVMGRLSIIAQKELNNDAFTSDEITFLQNILTSPGCATPVPGWYQSHLFFDDNIAGSNGFLKKDFIAADIHTAPTDSLSNPVGWVKHVGTGAVDLGVFIIKCYDGQTVAFIGPVGSYYEYTSNNFFRISDEEWVSTYLINAARPSFVNLYLAGPSGSSFGAGNNLITGVENEIKTPGKTGYILAANYPNPFNAGTVISFTIPYSSSYPVVELAIYDINGRTVKKLVNEQLLSGTYTVRWDGTNTEGRSVTSGVYIYRLKAGEKIFSGKMSLLK